jgi:antitoxin component YwqK of YwqJK toxin-antitoxin module
LWPAGEPGVDYNRRNADKSKEGTWIKPYPNKNLYYRGQFHQGVPTGRFEFYYETGELMSEVDHVKDSTINDVINYYPDGLTPMSQGRYLGSIEGGKFTRKKEGPWKLYLADGTLSAEENYKAGQLNGNCRYYFPNKKLCKSVTYLNGIQEGAFTEYYDDGNKKMEGTYKLDEFDGEHRTYFPGGQPETKGQYTRGLKDGLWIHFLQSGRVEMTIKYQLGKEIARRYDNGTFMEYYDNGIPKSDYTYEDGKKNGPFSEWYDMGEFVTVPTSPEESQTGITFRQKLTGTQLKITGDYLDDHFEGEITWYNTDGSVSKVENWVNGKLESSSPGR